MELDKFLPMKEVKKMRDFEQAYISNKNRVLTQAEAAIILGISERQFRRKKAQYESNECSFLSLLDKRIGNTPPNKVPVDQVNKILSLYRHKYYDFNAKHFHEKLVTEHKQKVSYSWTKKVLQNNNLITRGKKRSKHRKKRERKAMVGMMIHQDASTHDWLNLGYNLDLVVTMDDANNEIYSAFLIEQEGTKSTMQGLLETFSKKGLAASLYSDRGSHYTTTRKRDEPISDTQVERALKSLAVTSIKANSPQARGRSERMFDTLQNRLPQELRINNIKTLEEANIFIKIKFLPNFNRQFCKEPALKESSFVECDYEVLKESLCIHEERVVNNDNTVSYRTLKLQIPSDGIRYHYVKCKVTIHEYLDGNIGIFYGPRRLALYDSSGSILNQSDQKV